MAQVSYTSCYRITFLVTAMRKQHSGFTLIELLVAIAVAAIVLTLGVPSFERVIERNQLTANINELVASLNYARSEAVRRNQRVSICHSNDATTCSGADFEEGWIIFEDLDQDGDRDNPADVILRVHAALPANISLGDNLGGDLSFRPSGRANKAGRFVMCKDNDLTKARAIFMVINGRVRLAKLDNNGTPLDGSGTPITACL